MTMSATEKKVIRNVIRRLRCAPRPSGEYGESPEVRLALTGTLDPYNILSDEKFFQDGKAARRTSDIEGRTPHARLYLNSWVVGALESLLDEEDGGTGRYPSLALSLSE